MKYKKKSVLDAAYTTALKNYAQECFYCKDDNKDELLVHHLDEDLENNDVANLRIMCEHCYIKQHKHPVRPGFDESLILNGWRDIIKGLGLDLTDPNLKGTPERILRSYGEIFEALDCQDKVEKLFSTSFPSNYSGIVVIDNIECYSMCPHHFLPVEYKVHVGYISKQKMIGISKLPRLVELLARQPALQESFTEDVARALMSHLDADGAMVMVYGQHMCMRMRGVEKGASTTITSSIKGVFENDSAARAEFMRLIQLNKQ